MIKRGDIYIAQLPTNDITGSRIQHGKRPVIIVTNDKANEHSPVIHVVPLTSQMSKAKLPTHVNVGEESGLMKESIALVEQSQLIDKVCLHNKIGECATDIMRQINKALDIQFKHFDYDYVYGLLGTLSDINRVSRIAEENKILNIGQLKCKQWVSEQIREYCSKYNINYKNVIEEYKNEMRTQTHKINRLMYA